jgi:hypothetical protein
MWHDEAALALNVLGKGFGKLLGPLFFAEAAPPLFLWVEKAVVLVLGDGTYALRLVPFLASCGALVLVAVAAQRLLQPRAVPWAVLLFACSDQILWHTCEAKPYAVEVFCAAGLVAVYSFTRQWTLGRQLFLYGLLAPPVIWLAYPGGFLYGGVLMALLPAVWKSGRAWDWLGYAALTVVVGVSFGALVLGPVHAQRCEAMTSCWLDLFAPWDRPWKVPVWTVASTLEVGRYCCRPIGQVFVAAALVGAVLLWKRGQSKVLALLTLPVGLALIASYLHAYPYGGVRVLVYAAPALVLLTGEGVAVALDWLGARSRLAAAGLAALVAIPVGLAVYRVVEPWDRADCAGASAYVLAHRRPGDPVAGNHWEYQYYFRRLGPALTPLVGAPRPPSDRLWLVLSGDDAEDRRRMASALAPVGWHTLEQREFVRTTVFLMRRR